MSKADVNGKAKETAMDESQGECPIFLRKTYHMIDTCNPSIACWSKDGETFIVKNTDVFEKSIIPQFFKHSKFSSFVRQLNFYGFRKIKYADTIKIDPKLEAETASFWRFRHDKFRRGRPELLTQIKRSNGHHPAPSSKDNKPEDTGSLKTEVSTLKKRIEAMTKNIDELTSLVEKVSLKQEKQDADIKEDPDAQVGSKRKKIDNMVKYDDIRPDEATSAIMDLDKDMAMLADMPPMPTPLALSRRQSSEPSSLSDDDFVDQLFTAFGNDDVTGILEDVPSVEQEPLPPLKEKDNAPDPALMKKLSDALSLLPREIQELMVEKLIAAITNTGALEKNLNAVSTLSDVVADEVAKSPSQVPPSPVLEAKATPEISLPLAAATLHAFLSQYGTIKDKAHVQKVPPVIPIHA